MAPPSGNSYQDNVRSSNFGESQGNSRTDPAPTAQEFDKHTRTLDGTSITPPGSPEPGQPGERADFPQNISSQLNDAVVAVDTQYGVRWWNKSAEQIYGLTAEQALGQPLAKVCGGWWATTEGEKLASDQLAATGTWRGDMTQVRADGQEISVELSVSVLKDQSGATTGYAAVIRDVTSRKQLEDALRASEQRYRELVETLNVVGWEADPNTFRITYISPQVEQLLGYSVEQCLADPDFWVKHLYPQDRDSTVASAHQAIAQRGPGELECRRVATDGRVRWIRNVARVLCDAAGIPNRMLGFSEDITARKEAEQALRKSQERLAEAQRIAHLGSWEWDVTNDHLAWSDELRHLLGLTPQSFAATYEAFLKLVHPGDRALVMQTLDRALHHGESHSIDFRVVRQDGLERIFQGKAEVYLDSEGKPVRMAGTVQDVTEQRRVEEELRKLSGRLMRVEDEERRRIGRELHDTLGQSLTALQANLAVAEKSLPRLKPHGRESLAESRSLAKHCLEEVRTLSYLLYPPLLDDMGLGVSLRWYVRGFVDRSRIRVKLQMPAGLGRLPHEAETALFRVVQESLTNISRHSGSRTAGIRIVRDSCKLQLEVTDQGSGMTIGAGGATLGVGIRSMRERMRQIGGRLEIVSSSKGTTVRAIFPLPEG